MEDHERYRVQEVEGFAEAISHGARNNSGLWPVIKEMDATKVGGERRVIIEDSFQKASGPLLWFSVLAQIGAYSLKLGLLIFDKLDSIESLLIQQELRERNKEGR